ncbi:MAG: ROK family transcriptional regulator [Chitinophagaceae bacterium]|nr:ROK family transcriptional regulator [Chitinophagaceae bacterium]
MEKSSKHRRAILKELFFNGELSVGEIASVVQKSQPMIGKTLAGLIKDGWIIESGYATSTGGRRPQKFSLSSDKFYVVAIAVDQHITQAAIIDATQNIVGNIETLTLDLKDNKDAACKLADFITNFIKKSGVIKNKIAGIGVGMPGFINTNEGINHTYFNNVQGSIASFLSDKTGLPVYIENDSSVMALAELRMGSARNRKNVMVVNIGWGIGLGMILNGELFRGDSGFAGEFSHMSLFSSNKMCDCGKAGCLEAEASLYVIAEKAIEGIREGKVTVLKGLSLDRVLETINKIFAAAVRGDKFAVELLSETAFKIGRGVAILIHIINPGQIILTGRGTVAGKLWLAPLQQALNMYCIPRLAENTTVEISLLGDKAGLMGAAALVIENLNKEFISKVEKNKNSSKRKSKETKIPVAL